MLAYLDNSATTKPCPEAVAAMVDALETGWGNPSALYRFGMDAARRLRVAREQVAKALGAEPDRVFFTSGGTEADNWAVGSSMERMGKRGKHVVTTAVEHHAVLNPVKRLEERGFAVTYLEPDASGRIGLEDFKQALRPDTVFVSVMMVNNESGAVMPVGAMAKWTRRLAPQAIFHTDAVQGFLKVPSRPDLGGGFDLRLLPQDSRPQGGGRAVCAPGLVPAALPFGRRPGGGYRSARAVPRWSLWGGLRRRAAHLAPGPGPGGGSAGPLRRASGGDSGGAGFGRPGSAPHSSGLDSRRAGAEYHQHFAGSGDLRLGRFRLRQGTPEPCAAGDESCRRR